MYKNSKKYTEGNPVEGMVRKIVTFQISNYLFQISPPGQKNYPEIDTSKKLGKIIKDEFHSEFTLPPCIWSEIEDHFKWTENIKYGEFSKILKGEKIEDVIKHLSEKLDFRGTGDV